MKHTIDQDDDQPIGRILSRREVLGLFGAAGGALLVACSGGSSSTPSAGNTPVANAQSGGTTTSPAPGASAAAANVACVVRPELTEGPYFVDEKLNRSDVRSDSKTGAVKDGAPLTLTFNVSSVAGGCVPLAGAMVDIWHCDAAGAYSDVSDQGFNTKGQNFLRGYQLTDAAGKATFTTIYPGWYQGRAVHIHFKIRTTNPAKQSYEFTSQFFFDETLTDQVYAQAPYAQKGAGRLKNSGDSIFRQSNGQMILEAARNGNGYAGAFNIGLDLTDAKVGAPDGAGAGGGGPGGPAGRPPSAN